MRALLFLALFSLALFSSLRFAIARGGETHSSLLSGFRNYGNSNSNTNNADIRRHLSEGSKFQQSFGMTHDYMTNMELEQALNDIGTRCKDISRVYSIGESVDGVPLWVIEISNKPGEEEAKPAFKYIGNVHGDEPLGRELLILLARWICINYKKDPLARFIVENVHLHILPSMNPDGFKLRKRGNANNIDLNRDFPDQFFPLNDDLSSRQPETRAVIKWMQDIRFTASASLHGGALVANYPWDGTEDKRKNYFACPDDDTFRFMASIYSRSHYNMSSSKEFPGGITNGAAWYPIYGGMQDWNYIHAGCFEITLEISDNKWPSPKEIPTLWEYNKMSLLSLAASVAKIGVHGRTFSSDGGNPIPALITVKGIHYTTVAGRGFADYHRLLPPGDRYEVTASMQGYKSKTAHISLGKEAMSLDFILDPEVPTTKWSFRSFNDCNCRIEIFTGVQSQVYIVLIISLAILCLLLLRIYKLRVTKP